MAQSGFFGRLVALAAAALQPSRRETAHRASTGARTGGTAGSGGRGSGTDAAEPGRSGARATKEVPPPAKDALVITYSPKIDGDPDAGEVVWTWVPYAENDGRGKDRPVLVIGRAPRGRVYAVKLTSKPHEGDSDFLSIGSGAWDPQRRPSWVDIDQVYSIHPEGMRREAAAIDLDRFVRVANELRKRYGWAAGRG